MREERVEQYFLLRTFVVPGFWYLHMQVCFRRVLKMEQSASAEIVSSQTWQFCTLLCTFTQDLVYFRCRLRHVVFSSPTLHQCSMSTGRTTLWAKCVLCQDIWRTNRSECTIASVTSRRQAFVASHFEAQNALTQMSCVVGRQRHHNRILPTRRQNPPWVATMLFE